MAERCAIVVAEPNTDGSRPRGRSPAPPSGVGAARRVLVVEDDPGLLSVIELLLRHYEFLPQLAPTLADARRSLAVSDPDVVVLDLNLPDGNGVDLLEHLRSTGRRARVIVLTAGSDAEHLRRLRFLRPDRLFRKPMNFLELLEGIRSEVTDATVGVAGQAALNGTAARSAAA
jgi:two-component system response regulator AtoC